MPRKCPQVTRRAHWSWESVLLNREDFIRPNKYFQGFSHCVDLRGAQARRVIVINEYFLWSHRFRADSSFSVEVKMVTCRHRQQMLEKCVELAGLSYEHISSVERRKNFCSFWDKLTNWYWREGKDRATWQKWMPHTDQPTYAHTPQSHHPKSYMAFRESQRKG